MINEDSGSEIINPPKTGFVRAINKAVEMRVADKMRLKPKIGIQKIIVPSSSRSKNFSFYCKAMNMTDSGALLSGDTFSKWPSTLDSSLFE